MSMSKAPTAVAIAQLDELGIGGMKMHQQRINKVLNECN